MKGDAMDPKGLIADAYRIEGITVEECRSIFLDWALSVPVDVDTGVLIGALMQRHGEEDAHPMTAVLRDGLTKITAPRRRGGVRARHPNMT